MKSVLEFDLPEENDDFLSAINGWKYNAIIFDLQNWLRSKYKHEDLTEQEYDLIEKIREYIAEQEEYYKVVSE